MRRFIRWLGVFDAGIGVEEFTDCEGYPTLEAFKRWEESRAAP